MLANVTTNERLNGSRYAWIGRDPKTDAWRSRFDRGFWRANVLEFCGWEGYDRDYMAVFELPPLLAGEGVGAVGVKRGQHAQQHDRAAVVAAV